MTRIFSYSSARLSVRFPSGNSGTSRFSAVRAKNSGASGSRFSARSTAQGGSATRCSTRQTACTVFACRSFAVRLATLVVSAGRFDVYAKHATGSGTRFSARSGEGSAQSDRYGARFPTRGMHPVRFEWRKAVRNINRIAHDSLVPHGWTLSARNADTDEVVKLGFIAADADPKVLEDKTLADGVWEIEARPSQWFWNECRGRKIVTLIAGEVDGGGEPQQGLPVIQNLRREITNFQSVIRWKVSLEYQPLAFQFGLWFSTTSPVDTSGEPDQVVQYFSDQAVHSQTETEYVAVAAFTDDEIGPVAELELPWESDSPDVPPNQTARRT